MDDDLVCSRGSRSFAAMSSGLGSKLADLAHRGAILLCVGGISWAGFKLGQSAYRGTLLANFRKQAEEGRADMYSLSRLGGQDKAKIVSVVLISHVFATPT